MAGSEELRHRRARTNRRHKTSRERRYYIGSLPADAKRIAHAVRSHWEVENRLHWCLDVQFNEDQSTAYRLRRQQPCHRPTHRDERPSPQHLSQGSIKTKRMLAATSDQFRAELLGVMT